MQKDERRKIEKRNTREIIMLSAWGFTLVVSSFLFLFVGRWIDVRLNTEPAFMVGLLILGIGLAIGRLYVDYTRTSRHIGTVRRHKI